MTDYYIILTDAGAALETAAHATGEPLVLTEFAVCDGGAALTPDPAMTTLENEVYRGAISSLSVSPDDPSVLVTQCIIPSSSGGYTIRGIGLYAGNTLYAVGNYPDQPKPAPDSGYAASLEILARLAVSDTTDITLNVTDGAWLTKEEGDQLYVPLARTVNGHALTKDITLTAEDVGVVEAVYPVGIVAWFAQNKNPNVLFPGTTWKYIGENKTIRLAAEDGSDIMTTGGSDSVTLAVGNLPAHGHTFSANTSSFDYGTKTSSSTGAHTHPVSGTAASAGAHYHLNGLQPDQSHNGINGIEGSANNGSCVAFGGGRAGQFKTSSSGAHTHPVSGTAASAGAHAHTTAIGAHGHNVSGATANTGSGSAINITNIYIKLMAWYRSA